jgi:hypothetical protein
MKRRPHWLGVALCAVSLALPVSSMAEQGKRGRATYAQGKTKAKGKSKAKGQARPEAGTTGVVGPQMRYRGMDLNNDGIIQRDEWRGAPEAFASRDWNGDGVLSGDEVRPGASRPTVKKPPK